METDIKNELKKSTLTWESLSPLYVSDENFNELSYVELVGRTNNKNKLLK